MDETNKVGYDNIYSSGTIPRKSIKKDTINIA